MSAPLLIATLFPLATVAAGDEANAAALVRRAASRGIPARAIVVNRPEDAPDASVYLLGGSGRSGVADLVDLIARTALAQRVRSGAAVVLAVDAGMDALARTWVDERGRSHPGIGLLDVDIRPGAPSTATVITRPTSELGLPAMVGWESRDTQVVRGPGALPLAQVEIRAGATGSAGGSAPEPDGAITDRILATALHGPVLALNPELADVLLARAVGRHPGWAPLPVPAVQRAREVRIKEVRGSALDAPGRRGRGLRLRGRSAAPELDR